MDDIKGVRVMTYKQIPIPPCFVTSLFVIRYPTIPNLFDSFAVVSATEWSIACDWHVLSYDQPVHRSMFYRPVSIWPHSLLRCQSHASASSFSTGTVDTRAQIMVHLSPFLCKRVHFVSEPVWASWRSHITESCQGLLNTGGASTPETW
jgi:hypothetical protein